MSPVRRYVDPGGWIDRLLLRCGRRGAFLAILGFMWIMQGFGVATAPGRTGEGAYLLLHEQLPTTLRVMLWVGSGLAALAAAMFSSPERDRWGYTVLVIMPLERGASYFIAWLVHMLPLTGGYSPGLRGASVWFATAAAVMIVSGWAEPRQTSGGGPNGPGDR